MLFSMATRQTIESLGDRWKLSNDEIARAAWLVEHGTALDRASQLAWSQLQPLLIHRGSAELFGLLIARAENGLNATANPGE